jgi:hypothetical protein
MFNVMKYGPISSMWLVSSIHKIITHMDMNVDEVFPCHQFHPHFEQVNNTHPTQKIPTTWINTTLKFIPPCYCKIVGSHIRNRVRYIVNPCEPLCKKPLVSQKILQATSSVFGRHIIKWNFSSTNGAGLLCNWVNIILSR